MTLSDVAAQLDALIQEWQKQESSYSEDRDVSATALVASSWLRECISDLQALRDTIGTPEVSKPRCEDGRVQAVKEHWFIQGGEAQFGPIRDANNADEVVADILSLVRQHAPASGETP